MNTAIETNVHVQASLFVVFCFMRENLCSPLLECSVSNQSPCCTFRPENSSACLTETQCHLTSLLITVLVYKSTSTGFSQIPCVSEVMLNLSFCVWLISLSIMFSRFIHVMLEFSSLKDQIMFLCVNEELEFQDRGHILVKASRYGHLPSKNQIANVMVKYFLIGITYHCCDKTP